MGKRVLLVALWCPLFALANQLTLDSLMREFQLEEVIVTSTRLGQESKLNRQHVTQEELEERNMGANLPYLLTATPSLVVTSDDGLGIGYAYFRVRGSDQSRINMTINGVPLNDSESQSVFWVNMTDMASSMSSIEVQRGVGTSTNGPAAFGASVNMQTTRASELPYAEVSFNGGSYNTFRKMAKVGTGIMKRGFAIDARYSKVDSEGYVERANSNLYSYYASGAWYGERTLVKLFAFGGGEKSNVAWDGISPTTWRDNPRFNGADIYYDEKGNKQHYANNADNYQQQHYQAHLSHRLNHAWSVNAALHYTKGKGYTEQVKHAKLNDYGLDNYVDNTGNTVKRSNLVRQKWLDNHFYGVTAATNYQKERLKVSFGGAANSYVGDHFGYVINMLDVNHPGIPANYEYYRSVGRKVDANLFAKANWELVEGLSLYGDLQYRFIDYLINGINDDDLKYMRHNHRFHFVNPKGGITYQNGGHSLYGSFAVANREPLRNNYTEAGPNASPTHETLYDYELGYGFINSRFNIGANLYFMDYNNQLVLTGKISDVGAAITANVKDSYRAGVEFVGGIRLTDFLRWEANVTLSRNKIVDFTDWVDDYNADWTDATVIQNGGQVQVAYGTTDIAFSPSITAGSVVTFTKEGFAAMFQTNYVGSQYLDNTTNSAAKLPAYSVSNLALSYTMPFKKIAKNITFNVQMNNLFNKKYVSNGWVYSYFAGPDRSGRFLKENQQYDDANIGYFSQALFNIHAGVVVRF